MKEVILILGGTKEAAALAEKLVEQKPDARIISSLAGRTKEPQPVAGELRIGGFGGTQGLVRYISENAVTRLIDATHPFATTISYNAREAAQRAKIYLEVRQRSPWQEQPGDNWIEVADRDGAREAIPSDARVLLALGSQHIEPFAARRDVHFLVRMIDPPASTLPFEKYTLELGRPGDVAHETELLKKHMITHMVCRNSGGEGAYAKIEAARNLNIPVIIMAPPS